MFMSNLTSSMTSIHAYTPSFRWPPRKRSPRNPAQTLIDLSLPKHCSCYIHSSRCCTLLPSIHRGNRKVPYQSRIVPGEHKIHTLLGACPDRCAGMSLLAIWMIRVRWADKPVVIENPHDDIPNGNNLAFAGISFLEKVRGRRS